MADLLAFILSLLHQTAVACLAHGQQTLPPLTS
jgi:hypothetical protein